MPSRTYTGVDLDNYQSVTNQHTQADGGTASISSPGGAVVSLSGSGSQNRVPPGPGLSANRGVKGIADVTVSGDFDYDAVPAIPDNAIITSIEFGYTGSVTGSGTNDSDGPGAGFQCVDIAGSVISSISGASPPTVDTADDSAVDDGNSEPVSMSDSVTPAIIFTDNFGGTPITKAQLQLAYPSIAFDVIGSGECGACASASGVYGVVSFDWTVSLSNFFFRVNYDLPGIDIALDPSGGNVEPGQIIRVTGPNIGGVAFAGAIGNYIVPLNVKQDGDDLLIEVPYPPTDECVDCLTTDCTECEDCFTVCNEDLDSAECQECMAACLECLENCLENVELAEDCDGSSRTAPQVNLVVIASDTGNQFSGSVSLGNFIILVANGSGIYRFVDGKTNDTVYSTARDGTTLDIKIPNPFGKSGFFRS